MIFIQKMFMFRFLNILLLFVIGFSVNAVEVTDLYQAKVKVSSQAKKDRDSAIKEAMRGVLLKVGGHESILSNATIKSAFNNFQQYLIQFSFQKTTKQAYLIASFNEEKIKQLFAKAELPLWGNLRPQILLWLIDERGLTRTIISESSHSKYPQFIRQFSEKRGLPISLPLMDITDLSEIRISDVWGRFAEPIRKASVRYQAETSIVIRLSNSSLVLNNEKINDECDLLCRQNNFVLDWRMYTQENPIEQSFSKKYQGSNRELLLLHALNDITQEIYQYYALNSNDNKQLIIDVANVNSMARYVEVCTFLENLSSVDSVSLIVAKGENRRFKLHLLGSDKSLLASLKLNKNLQQYVDPLADVVSHAPPIFYWKKP